MKDNEAAVLRAVLDLAHGYQQAGGPQGPLWHALHDALSAVAAPAPAPGDALRPVVDLRYHAPAVRPADADVRPPDAELYVRVPDGEAGGEWFVRLAVPGPGLYAVAARQPKEGPAVGTSHALRASWSADLGDNGMGNYEPDAPAASAIVRAEQWSADPARLRALLGDDDDGEDDGIPPELRLVTPPAADVRPTDTEATPARKPRPAEAESAPAKPTRRRGD